MLVTISLSPLPSLPVHEDHSSDYGRYDFFPHDIKTCRFRLNPADTLYPTPFIDFFGFRLSGPNMTIYHPLSRVDIVHDFLSRFSDSMPLTFLRREAGLLVFYLSLYRTGFFVLRPLYARIHYGIPLPPTCPPPLISSV